MKAALVLLGLALVRAGWAVNSKNGLCNKCFKKYRPEENFETNRFSRLHLMMTHGAAFKLRDSKPD